MCPLLNISPLERLFVSQSVPHTQRTATIRKLVWFSLKMLRCRARALPSYALVGHFYSASCTCVRITIGAHAQYYTWCNRAFLIRPLEFVRCYLCCSSCLGARYCMPTSSGTSKEIFAKARARHKVQSATALLH